MSPTTQPVAVFFAFANDRAERLAPYLRNLPEEQRQVRDAMAAAVEAGLCEVVERANATVDEVLDVFQDPKYRDRVALFHFGGHAGGAELLLESATGEGTVAHAGGLARFLGSQRGLELVFLNGCSSRGQVQGLLDAGVLAVIATSQSIDDGVATEFSTRFYKALASGVPIRTAYAEAQAAVQTRRGDLARGTYRSFVPELEAEDRWPWDLYVAPGAEDRAARWSLPLAARDPLFGLPSPPAMDLPPSPFKHLNWFTREDAEVFFGRGREIRDLYEAVTLPDAAPIVLLLGATGVGKSSLLAAGLAPRLEATHEVIYLRRDGAQGLAGTLARAFEAAGSEGDGAAADLDLGAAWRAREEAAGKPLVVILDQVEEAWTRLLAGRKEGEELAAALRSVFAVRETRPRGRLILGFRKEWLAEVLRLLDDGKLPRARLEAQHLGREGIIEAVAGPASSERLRRQYNLEVEPQVAEEIAGDLSEDVEAAVAPALQILLSKMWAVASQESPGAPRFTLELYQRLKRKGILLDDFLEEQLSGLKGWRPGLVESGLALDLLAYHTTPLGTAETRQAAEVVERYGGRGEVVELLGQCNDRYLLTGTARVQEGALAGNPDDPADKGVTRLAHDTLAPLVRRRFEASDLPGQRAVRVLQQRAVEWAGGKEGSPLDEVDLTLVEQGAAGMRAWTVDEQKLVAASIARKLAGHRKARRIQASFGLLVLLLAASGVGWMNQDILRKYYYWHHEMEASVVTADQEKELASQPKAEFADCKRGCPLMVVIPAGKFMMGTEGSPDENCNDSNPCEGRQHEVTIAKPFSVSKTEVTNAQWDKCVEAGACHETNKVWAGCETPHACDDRPVIWVTWEECADYVKWLSGLSGKDYRLLSEAEWEYAARAGTSASYSFGDDSLELDQYAWSEDNSGAETHPVGKKKANALRLQDVHGNVMEWVEDHFHNSYRGAPTDGTAWAEGGDKWRRIVRGGSWKNNPVDLRSASRSGGTLKRGYEHVGFRVARTLR